MPKPTVIITGTPDWAENVREQLEADYAIIHQAQPTGYMNAMIETLAALVLIDGDAADWTMWTSVPKSSPATRRVPLVLVSEDPETRAEADANGADVALTRETLLANASWVIEEHGRLPDPERAEQLACECEEALPPLAQEGIRKFNAGEFYKQHDLFEEQWVDTEGPVGDLYRAVLQVGVAYYQIERGNYRGALKMLQRSVQWLVILPDTCQGINVAKLRADSFKVRAELERLGPNRLDELDKSLLTQVEWMPQS